VRAARLSGGVGAPDIGRIKRLPHIFLPHFFEAWSGRGGRRRKEINELARERASWAEDRGVVRSRVRRTLALARLAPRRARIPRPDLPLASLSVAEGERFRALRGSRRAGHESRVLVFLSLPSSMLPDTALRSTTACVTMMRCRLKAWPSAVLEETCSIPVTRT
jgi:hypothetical protein